MDATNEAAQQTDEFYDASMHMIHITGFPRQQDVLVHPMKAPKAARLEAWQTNPDDGRHISGSLEGKAAFSTSTFALANSGNRTLRSPKHSWKISLEPDDGGKRLAGQARINLKSMYNDPSQMREALAWHMFGRAAIPSPRHTYAKLAFDATYFGLFAVIEQVDKRFLKDHFGANHQGNLYKAYCGDVGCATLEHRTGPDGDDSGRQYFVPGSDDHAYRLKTNGHDPKASSYDDLARFIKVINGVGLPGGTERFDTDAFRESVDAIMDTRTFLRWASVNVLLGSWDNYFKTPANYYLYNSGQPGAAGDFMHAPYFTFIPWDYDNCLGISYNGTQWQYTDILDWSKDSRSQRHDHGSTHIPLVRNLLRNREYLQYYLDYLEYLIDTEFNPRTISALVGAGSGDGLWARVRQAAYLESVTPYGQTFTGRQFSNDEVYSSGCQQNELRHGNEKVEGIVHYVRMRRDSARQQLHELRKTTPCATDPAAFAATMGNAAVPVGVS